MNTELLKPTTENIEKCAKLLQKGEIVAFPTETVYGLGGNALAGEAAKKIFAAKGRPMTNPLIVHVASYEQIDMVAHVTDTARVLIDKLMPGALTLVLKKKDCVPSEVTAGSSTVGVRMPDNKIALALIKAAGFPLCAPSANTSFRPSPTMAQHVIDDLGGKIPAVLDGGKCDFGVESTIIDLTSNPPELLRSGSVPLSKIEELIGKIDTDRVFRNELASGKEAANFMPKVDMLFSAYFTGMAKNINAYYDLQLSRSEKPVILCLSDRVDKYEGRDVIVMGDTVADYARNLFERIREAEQTYTVIIAEGVPKTEIGVTLQSRLVKLSRGQVI